VRGLIVSQAVPQLRDERQTLVRRKARDFIGVSRIGVEYRNVVANDMARDSLG
jgi:hypothetical protein